MELESYFQNYLSALTSAASIFSLKRDLIAALAVSFWSQRDKKKIVSNLPMVNHLD